jgi:hypothetical protein
MTKDVRPISFSPTLPVKQRLGEVTHSFLARYPAADSLASRTVAWDSSLFANASKVLSTRVLLPIAPQRHSAASALSNSGEYILSTWPLPCPGQKLMDAPIYR